MTMPMPPTKIAIFQNEYVFIRGMVDKFDEL
jgi:hypothetical protein